MRNDNIKVEIKNLNYRLENLTESERYELLKLQNMCK
jgi:hypothetical protein